MRLTVPFTEWSDTCVGGGQPTEEKEEEGAVAGGDPRDGSGRANPAAIRQKKKCHSNEAIVSFLKKPMNNHFEKKFNRLFNFQFTEGIPGLNIGFLVVFGTNSFISLSHLSKMHNKRFKKIFCLISHAK